MRKTYLIVGAGLYGAVCARQLTDAGHRCLVIERRDHTGGCCFSRYNEEAGCHQHMYGAHIFHTEDDRIWAYINRFARFNHFVNRPKVRYRERIYSFPINLFTLYQFLGVTTPAEAELQLRKLRVPCQDPRNIEDWCLSHVGREIYEKLILGYTIKQWRKHPKDLPVSIIKRLPIRLTFDDNLFSHPYQGIPIGGYSAIFDRLLQGIEVETGVDFLEDRDRWLSLFDHVIYTGAIDAFFRYSEGILEYRSLRFETELIDIPDFQGNAVFNYTDAAVPFIRIIEHKHFDMNYSRSKTLITREYPEDWIPGKEPYYPVETETSRQVLAKYRSRVKELDGKVIFGGRLGEYKYYDMDQVIFAALNKIDHLLDS
jgi:UDP-galactopyranose mutase